MKGSSNSLTDTIRLKACVRFKSLPRAAIIVFNVILQAGIKFRFEPWITGAAYERYPLDGIHNQGYAWDLRTWNIHNPQSVVDWITDRLKRVDGRYRTVYGDTNHLDHAHIEYRYSMTKGTQ